jgi:hypothetical protein
MAIVNFFEERQNSLKIGLIEISVFNLTETQPETRVFSKNPTQT